MPPFRHADESVEPFLRAMGACDGSGPFQRTDAGYLVRIHGDHDRALSHIARLSLGGYRPALDGESLQVEFDLIDDALLAYAGWCRPHPQQNVFSQMQSDISAIATLMHASDDAPAP